jgi:hypothetical protein
MAEVFKAIASRLEAIANCRKSDNPWEDRHREYIEALCKEALPSGSGFDAGSTLLEDESDPNRLVFQTSYHHMDEGTYCGWSEHRVIVTPSLAHGFDMKITGRNRRGIKDYIADAFQDALSRAADSFAIDTD